MLRVRMLFVCLSGRETAYAEVQTAAAQYFGRTKETIGGVVMKAEEKKSYTESMSETEEKKGAHGRNGSREWRKENRHCLRTVP